MAIVINGSSAAGLVNLGSNGTISNLAVGGLPDGTVDGDTLASGTGGKFASYAIICDQKSHDTAGGTFTKDAWRDRDLNTEIADADGIVSISSDQFTLGAGTYLINWAAPAYRVDSHMSRLYDVTGTAALQTGFSAHSEDSGGKCNTYSEGSYRHTITGNNVYKIQHYSTQTSSGDGFGKQANVDDAVERYTWVKIFKEA